MARIVFDLDGTLVDSAPDIRLAANAALEGTSATPLTLEETRSFVGSGAPVFVERMMRARDLPEDQMKPLLERFLHHYEGAVSLTQPYPDAVPVLEQLAAAGHHLGLCTNKPVAPTMAVLAHLNLARFFETILGGDSLSARKPSPIPLVAAFDGLGDAGTAIYVGDSEVDAETARRAEVPFVLYTEGYRHAEIDEIPHARSFSAWADLPAIFEALA